MTFERFKRGLRRRFFDKLVRFNNFILDIFRGRQAENVSDFAFLAEIQKRAAVRTDICDHLPALFAAGLAAKPKLIVELGVRGGESTFVFERAAKITGAKLLSVDMNDCKDASHWPEWNFVQSDDVFFARQFVKFCNEHGWEPKIDLLFVDTSHEYNHTKAEIDVWLPFVSENGQVVFHDTNLKEVYRRRDRSWGLGWNNERGVIRAIEEYFGKKFDESQSFIEISRGWIIQHESICQGFTILKRVSASGQE